jgi:3-oxoacyl-[acyl-carrier protein] reductase
VRVHAGKGIEGIGVPPHEIVELDPWGRVNLVEPGWTVTHMARPALDEPGTIARVVRTMSLRQIRRTCAR